MADTKGYQYRFSTGQPLVEQLGGTIRTTTPYGIEKQGLELEAKQLANERMRASIAAMQAQQASGGAYGNASAPGAQGWTPDAFAAREVADPFWQERKAYQAQLSDLMKNPGEFASSPMYQFAFDQGMQGVNRSMAAKGMLNSGNRLAELTKFGQGLASQQFTPMANLLGKLAGVDAGSPGAALSGMVTARGQDIDAATSRGNAALDANTRMQIADLQASDPLGFAKLEAEQNRDFMGLQAAKQAQRDAEYTQSLKNLPKGVFV